MTKMQMSAVPESHIAPSDVPEAIVCGKRSTRQTCAEAATRVASGLTTSRSGTPCKAKASRGRSGRSQEKAPSSSELKELLLASEMVPAAAKRSSSQQLVLSNTSTATPSSQEASPLRPATLAGGAADDEGQWPSLREATVGWDFCSDASDDECEEPSSPTQSWCVVPSSKSPRAAKKAEAAKKVQAAGVVSFAELIKGDGNLPKADLPPAVGTRMPLSSRPPRAQHSPSASPSGDDKENEQNNTVEDEFLPPGRGWKKQHKASHSAKLQRKVAERSAKRAVQSWRTRGWIVDEE